MIMHHQKRKTLDKASLLSSESETQHDHRSPRRATSFSPKQFGGPGKPEASLGELGSRKFPKKTFLPLPLVSVASLTKTSNNLSFCAVTSVEQHSSANENQNISE